MRLAQPVSFTGRLLLMAARLVLVLAASSFLLGLTLVALAAWLLRRRKSSRADAAVEAVSALITLWSTFTAARAAKAPADDEAESRAHLSPPTPTDSFPPVV